MNPTDILDRMILLAQAPEVQALDPGFAGWLVGHRDRLVDVVRRVMDTRQREARAHWRQLLISVEEVLAAHQQRFREGDYHYISPQVARAMIASVAAEHQSPGAGSVAPRDFDDAPEPLRSLLIDIMGDLAEKSGKESVGFFRANHQAQFKRLVGRLYAALRAGQRHIIKYTTAPPEFDYPRDVQTLETFVIPDDPYNTKPWRKVAIYDSAGPTLGRWYSGNYAVQDADPRILAEQIRQDRLRNERDRAYARTLQGTMEGITSLAEFERRVRSGEFDRLQPQAIKEARAKLEAATERARQEQAYREELEILQRDFPEGSTIIEYAVSGGHRYGITGVLANIRHPTNAWGRAITGTLYQDKGKPRPGAFSLPLAATRDRSYAVYSGPIPPAVIAKSRGREVVPVETSAGLLYWVQGYGGEKTLMDAAGKTIPVTRKLYNEALYGPPGKYLGSARIQAPDGHWWLTDGHAAYRDDVVPAGWPELDRVKVGMTWQDLGPFVQVPANAVPYRATGEEKNVGDRNHSFVWRPADGKGAEVWIDAKLHAQIRKMPLTFMHVPKGRGAGLGPTFGVDGNGHAAAVVMPMRKDKD